MFIVITCGILALLIFKNFLTKKILFLFVSVCYSKSTSLGTLRQNFKKKSCFVGTLPLRFEELYEVKGSLNNDVDALLARTEFVQRTETWSIYVIIEFTFKKVLSLLFCDVYVNWFYKKKTFLIL